MPTISVRVEDDLKDRAEEAAAGENMSVSEWTRKVMRAELGLDVPTWSAPSSLSKRDRHHLSLLHRILQLVSDDEHEKKHQETLIAVLEHGFTGEYSDEFVAVADELPLEECRLVWDILEMFSVIKSSIERVGIEAVRALDEHAEGVLQFRGFDFNDRRESRLHDYADHVIRNGRWTDLAEYFDNQHERGNSHMPVLDTYLRMHHVFQPIRQAMVHGVNRGRYHLNEAELLEIVEAALYRR